MARRLGACHALLIAAGATSTKRSSAPPRCLVGSCDRSRFELPSRATNIRPPLDTHKCITISMTSRELLRKLRRLGATVDPARGKGGHVQIELRGRKSIVPTGSGEIRRGTLFSILRDLRLRLDDLG
jgi:predicted RNA binding protein YcfA (HicA-like mRNA interferase family)